MQCKEFNKKQQEIHIDTALLLALRAHFRYIHARRSVRSNVVMTDSMYVLLKLYYSLGMVGCSQYE